MRGKLRKQNEGVDFYVLRCNGRGDRVHHIGQNPYFLFSVLSPPPSICSPAPSPQNRLDQSKKRLR